MKTLFAIVGFLFIPIILLSQEPTKTLDIITLKNGEIIETRIIRVNKRKLYYYEPKTFELIDVDRDEVLEYEFNDEYFKTNAFGELEHKEVVSVPGYSKGEIYRAIKDWFFINARGITNPFLIDDEINSIVLGTVYTGDYIKMDFLTVMSAMDNDPNTNNTYTLKYDVNVRVKDNRFKISITNFAIQSDIIVHGKMLNRTYEKRKTKEGASTIHGREIETLKNMIKTQILEIKDHCEYVREFDTFHNRIVKQALLDDDW